MSDHPAGSSPIERQPTYGNGRCKCGHLSDEHAFDHEASDMSCFRCDCEAFVSEKLPAASPSALRTEAERLLEGITPGEWAVAPCCDTDETRDVVSDYSERQEDGRTIRQAHWIAELAGDFDFDADEEAEFQRLEANAAFIAAAPRLVRDLLKRETQLEAENAQLRQRIRDLGHSVDR